MIPPKTLELPALNRHVPFIPQPIVREILLSLDAQTLFECSFACKDWNKLITSSDFIFHASRRNFDSREQLLLIKACDCEESRENRESFEREYVYFPYCLVNYSVHWDNDGFDWFKAIETPTVDDFKRKQVIGVSNGLICLANVPSIEFVLWNPSIRKYVWLPPMMDEKTRDERFYSVGFGFDHMNNDFKVVNLVYGGYLDLLSFANEFDSAWIFSYVTWSWKRLTCSILNSCCIQHCSPCAFFNGVLHWIARGPDFDDFILTFDLTREVFGKILLPRGQLRCLKKSYISSTEDSLLFIEMTNEREYDDEDNLEVFYILSTWTMKEYGNHESWTNISSVRSNSVNMAAKHILGARKNGDLILETKGDQIRIFNPATLVNFPIKAMENSVFFRYYTGRLYLLEKGELVSSY